MDILLSSDLSDSVVTGMSVGMIATNTVISIAVYVVYAIGLWKTFTKAGLPGILGIIPIVNWVFLVKIGGMNMWLALLYLIPLVNIVFHIVVAIKVGKNFGKGGAFSFFLLWLLPFIGYPVLGFGEARYQGA